MQRVKDFILFLYLIVELWLYFELSQLVPSARENVKIIFFHFFPKKNDTLAEPGLVLTLPTTTRCFAHWVFVVTACLLQRTDADRNWLELPPIRMMNSPGSQSYSSLLL